MSRRAPSASSQACCATTAQSRLPRVIRVGLHFRGPRPAASGARVARARRARRRRELARTVRSARRPLLARVVPDANFGAQVRARPATRKCCEQALLLGLCTALPLRPGAPRALDAREPDAARRALRARGVLRMNADHVRALLHELIDENPFAIRAVLKILCVEFTTDRADARGDQRAAPAAADQPRVRHARMPHRRTREGGAVPRVPARAAAAHEHHQAPLTPARHLALDAVINAIIHRQLGRDIFELDVQLLQRLTKASRKLLRPMTAAEEQRYSSAHPSASLPQLVARMARRSTPARCSPTTSSNWPRTCETSATVRRARLARAHASVIASTTPRARAVARQPRRR